MSKAEARELTPGERKEFASFERALRAEVQAVRREQAFIAGRRTTKRRKGNLC